MTMPLHGPHLLVLNAGSSSLRFAVFSADSLQRVLTGKVERIGSSDATIQLRSERDGFHTTDPVSAPDHAVAAHRVIDCVDRHDAAGSLAAIGHRVVHGGMDFAAPVFVTRDVLQRLHQLSPYDPEHLPALIALIEKLQQRFPHLPQIACFDTAFHRDLPRVARLLPIPRRFAGQGVERYGFHGLSYTFLMQEIERIAGTAAARGRLVLAHLGNGASLAAVRDGACIDTTMGFTPAAGIPMSTRSGDIDPGLVRYFADAEGMTAERFDQMINRESGLLGVSETSSDVRDLLAAEGSDPRAADAIAMFCYGVRKAIGALVAALGGIDLLVFAGGIGENAAPIRERICTGLEFLDLRLDPLRNAASEPLISAEASRVAIRIIRTDEEIVVARAIAARLKRSAAGDVQPRPMATPATETPS